MSTSGCPVVSASASSSRVSSTSLRRCRRRHVHELLHVPLRRFREVDRLVEAPAHAEMSPMSSSCMPARYGYQSARAGSQRCTWASTTRSIVMLRSSFASPHDVRRVSSTHGGSSGPPNEIDASGCGWLRTRSSPRSPRARRRTSRRHRRRRPGTRELTHVDAASRRRSPPRSRTHRSRRRGRGARRARAAPPPGAAPTAESSRRSTVTMRIGRPDARAWSLTARTHATSLRIASTIPACSASTCSQAVSRAARSRADSARRPPCRGRPRRAPPPALWAAADEAGRGEHPRRPRPP